ncbi:MAG: hypothetical protein ACRCYC_10360 [Paraclostridium sp.]|uniref:hypothetical protein n=1 Tax=Paraclostridium sp. TaxID=2023273 RepID=UPI003F2E4B3D
MVKKKNSINQNFEALKAQMQAKKKLAENNFEKEKNTENIESEESNQINDNEEIITLNIIDDEVDSIEAIENVNLEEEVQTLIDIKDQKENPTIIESTKKKQEIVSDININKIVIKKVEKQEAPKRITYYLKPETIKKIDKFSKATGMGKSEFVQTILDEILNNLEVEK